MNNAQIELNKGRKISRQEKRDSFFDRGYILLKNYSDNLTRKERREKARKEAKKRLGNKTYSTK